MFEFKRRAIMKCYLVMHGKDDDTIRGGWSNSCLTEDGIAHVKDLADYISTNLSELNINKIFSSDLLRAVQTAEIISLSANSNIEYLPEFRVTNNGLLAGMPNELANQNYPHLYWNKLDWNESFPNGESPCSFFERINDAWESFNKVIATKNENVILITHEGVINVICCIIENKLYSNKNENEKIPNASMIELEYHKGIWKRIGKFVKQPPHNAS